MKTIVHKVKFKVKELINLHWDDFYTPRELAEFLLNGFVFGPFGRNEHYLIDEYMTLINEVEIEKTPIEVVEDVPVVEEPIEDVNNEGI
jgi:hypothetical protein